MPRFATYFSLGITQHQLDFVNVSNDQDTPVYVDPYAIEISDDEWAAQASDHIRSFFKEVLDALRDNNLARARNLMSNLTEPRETYLGVSRGRPQGRGVGKGQSNQLMSAIQRSKAFKSGILSDLSEMALYVDGIDRDKISDLTTNIIRGLLVEYTQQQCELHEIETIEYNGPPVWSITHKNWMSEKVQIPYIKEDPVLLVPKYIVRRKLSLDSQEFYNKQITDFLVSEHLRANDSLVHVIKGERKVFKSKVREEHPKSKAFIADTVIDHPELLELYKSIAKRQKALEDFGVDDEVPTLTTVCESLAAAFEDVPSGPASASQYHKLVMGVMTALFYPNLISPRKEWEIHDGRKRIDIVYTNAGDTGFFAQRRDDQNVQANTVIVECKNYSSDIANPELDQLIGRFDRNRGYLGIVACRKVDKRDLLLKRCQDAATRGQGFIIILTDEDLIEMLRAQSQLNDKRIEHMLHEKFRELSR